VSNVFVKGTAPFYPVPQFLISSGILKSLRGGAHKLYQFILFTAQQRTRVAFELSNPEIRRAVDLSPNTIRRARTELKEVGLVDLRQAPGGRYAYIILNRLTGTPLPHPSSRRGGSTPSTPPNPSKPPFASVTSAPSWTEINK